MMNRFQFTVLVFVALSATPAFCEDAGWGHLTGRFTYDGDPPAARTFTILKDKDAFGDKITDESLIVNEKNRGIANIVVYLLPEKNGKLRVHPSYESTANAKVDLAMERGRFAPRILLLRTSQIMRQHNKDYALHNAEIQFRRNGRL